ncbi:MAG: type II toxin-antitoxin system VapC family toxin [Thaumarchaeota archaeon]|nr:type II toxin-antitoxin system VapC family toxin [Nitrososphaerota archaeon]
MVCVDTDFLVALERSDKNALEKMQEFVSGGDIVYVTAVTVAEFYRGAYGSKDRTKALNDVKGLLDRFAILNLDYESGKIWGEMAKLLKSVTIGDRDLFIASMALSNKQVLITKNKKHFERVPGLQVEGW